MEENHKNGCGWLEGGGAHQPSVWCHHRRCVGGPPKEGGKGQGADVGGHPRMPALILGLRLGNCARDGVLVPRFSWNCLFFPPNRPFQPPRGRVSAHRGPQRPGSCPGDIPRATSAPVSLLGVERGTMRSERSPMLIYVEGPLGYGPWGETGTVGELRSPGLRRPQASARVRRSRSRIMRSAPR